MLTFVAILSLGNSLFGQSALYHFSGEGPQDFLREVAAGGNLDNDGTPDFVYGIPGDYIEGGACTSIDDGGIVVVRSGVDGTIIFAVTGTPFTCETVGFSLDGVGDVNGDGFDDIAIGHDGQGAGQVIVAGGSPPALIHLVNGPTSSSFFGNRVYGAGDVNGDGTPDFAAFSFAFDSLLNALPGELTIMSGVDASPIHTLVGASPLDRYGAGFESVGDLNGDGKDEFIVGSWGSDVGAPNGGLLELRNGSDATVLWSYSGTTPAAVVGDHGTFAPLGDVNFDGFPDIRVADNELPNLTGQIRLISTRDLTLEMSRHQSSIADGVNVTFNMAFPATEAGNAYFILGSFTGFTPGISLPGGIQLPLNPDELLNLTADPATNPVLPSAGFVPAGGSAVATLQIPANGLSPTLAGLTFYWAYVTYDAIAGQFSFASNHTTHTLLP